MVQVVGVGVEVDCVEVVYASWWRPWGPECSSYCLRLRTILSTTSLAGPLQGFAGTMGIAGWPDEVVTRSKPGLDISNGTFISTTRLPKLKHSTTWKDEWCTFPVPNRQASASRTSSGAELISLRASLLLQRHGTCNGLGASGVRDPKERSTFVAKCVDFSRNMVAHPRSGRRPGPMY